MFDNLNQQNNPGQAGQKISSSNTSPNAEDIFADTEPVIEKPSQFQPIVNNGVDNFAGSEPGASNLQKIFFIIIALFGFIVLGTAGYFAYKYFLADKVIVQTNEQSEINNANTKNATSTVVTPEKIATSAVVSVQVVDTDKDGLSDEEEQVLGTSINNTDTDSDGLSDRQEVKIYKTDPKNPDTDNDGLNDGDEVSEKKNPNGDGDLFSVNSATTTSTISSSSSSQDEGLLNDIASSSKNTSTTNKTILDNNIDTDRDGLTDFDEINKYKTNYLVSDTDGDGYSDGVEVRGGFDPLIGKNTVNSNIDSDQDGLTDVEEKKYKTDPLNSDTDRDGYSDGVEVNGGFNPNGTGKLPL